MNNMENVSLSEKYPQDKIFDIQKFMARIDEITSEEIEEFENTKAKDFFKEFDDITKRGIIALYYLSNEQINLILFASHQEQSTQKKAIFGLHKLGGWLMLLEMNTDRFTGSNWNKGQYKNIY